MMYRFRTAVTYSPAESGKGIWTEQEIFIQIPAENIRDVTAKAVALGQKLGVCLIGPLGEDY